jgi:creatinine amidohydrolase
MKGRSRNWWDLTTADFAALDMEKVVAILPVAAIEQHGPHLPVRVDAAINQGMLDRAIACLPDDVEALVLPAMPIGKSNEHLAFPGTLSLSYETLGRAWYEVAECVARSGCRRLVFFNSHGGQPQLIDIVCRELRVKLEMFAVACSWFGVVDLSDVVSREEIEFGIHAGQIETSIMLHLWPDLVRMIEAQKFVSTAAAVGHANMVLRMEGSTGIGWQAQDLNRHGACGDATLATAELGRIIVDRAAEALATLIAEVADYPLTRIETASAYPLP